jgi:putative Mn2+ efflux pump MntP
VQSAQDTIIGCVLILTGVGFAVLELTGHGHHHEHEHDHHHGHDGLAAVMVPFGAAASPDLTILPVFLAATTAGPTTAISSLLIFAVVTIGTIVSLTLLACFGGYQLRGQWLERWGNAFTALVLIIIGALVLSGLI